MSQLTILINANTVRARTHILLNPLPDEKTISQPGETFGFEFTLIGIAKELLPIIARSFDRMGKMGLGKNRGRFVPIKLETLEAPYEYNPTSIPD